MPSKMISLTSSLISVKRLVMELEADATSFVTLRVKPDRRQSSPAPALPAELERRAALQPSFVRKPVAS